jgi:hypothetical protein
VVLVCFSLIFSASLARLKESNWSANRTLYRTAVQFACAANQVAKTAAGKSPGKGEGKVSLAFLKRAKTEERTRSRNEWLERVFTRREVIRKATRDKPKNNEPVIEDAPKKIVRRYYLLNDRARGTYL